MSDKLAPEPLDEFDRVRAVLNAAGRAARIAEQLPDKHRKALAALCSVHGVCHRGVAEQAISILRRAGEELKAAGLEDKE